METSTLVFYMNESYYHTEEDYVREEYVNDAAKIGCWVTFLVLACLLNGLVIASVVQHPAARKIPKLLAMTVCSALMILEALGMHAVVLHWHVAHSQGHAFKFNCAGLMSLQVISDMIISGIALLITAVLLLQALQLQPFVKLTLRMQMMAVLALVVSPAMYALVVVVPFYFFVRLEDPVDTCYKEFDFPRLAEGAGRIRWYLTATLIVPHGLLLVSCVLLLLTYFAGRSRARAQRSCPQGTSESGLANMDRTTLVSDTHWPQQHDPPLQPSGVGSGGQENHPAEGAPPFPFHLLLAAAVSLLFRSVGFVPSFLRLDIEERAVRHRLSVAIGLLQVLVGVGVPCCWLLDRDVRAAWNCCFCPWSRSRSTATVHAPTDQTVRSPTDDRGGERVGMVQMEGTTI